MDPLVVVSTLLIPFLTQGMKWLLAIDPEAKGKMKLVACVLTASAAVLNVLAGDAIDANSLTNTLLVFGGMFLAQDGLYNSVLKPLFTKLNRVKENG